MIVVSDATPLISLMKANRLDILEPLFKEVLIPEAVYSELTGNPNYAEEAEQISSARFIRIVSVKEQKVVDVLRRSSGLDLGESEAIVYADDNKADVLLMDEARGRQVARAMGIYIMGTVGVLLFAHEEKLMSGAEIEAALHQMKEAGRHIGDEIIKYALSKLKEQKNAPA